ncbi:MAG TPA: GNAT family N-acetyltransferase [Angustibacter sp.]|nr:GNAT family N-acetyltransferase [Angustibacter sp.]
MSAPAARRATVADVAELVRLRGVMFASMGEPHDGPWVGECQRFFVEHLGGGRLAASVVEAPDGVGLAACAVGMLDLRLPSPTRQGPMGHISSVATDERWRRRGFARAAVSDLMGWFVEQGAGRVQLSASSEGESLYRSLGFSERRQPTLSWQPER